MACIHLEIITCSNCMVDTDHLGIHIIFSTFWDRYADNVAAYYTHCSFFSVRNSERIIIKMRLLTVSNRKCAFTFCKRIFCIKKFNSVFGNRSMNCYELSRFIIKFRFVSHICYQGNVVVRLSQKLLLSTFFCINRVGNKHNFSFSNRDPIRCKRHYEDIIRKDGGDSFPPPPGFDGEPSPRRMRSPKG